MLKKIGITDFILILLISASVGFSSESSSYARWPFSKKTKNSSRTADVSSDVQALLSDFVRFKFDNQLRKEDDSYNEEGFRNTFNAYVGDCQVQSLTCSNGEGSFGVIRKTRDVLKRILGARSKGRSETAVDACLIDKIDKETAEELAESDTLEKFNEGRAFVHRLNDSKKAFTRVSDVAQKMDPYGKNAVPEVLYERLCELFDQYNGQVNVQDIALIQDLINSVETQAKINALFTSDMMGILEAGEGKCATKIASKDRKDSELNSSTFKALLRNFTFLGMRTNGLMPATAKLLEKLGKEKPRLDATNVWLIDHLEYDRYKKFFEYLMGSPVLKDSRAKAVQSDLEVLSKVSQQTQDLRKKAFANWRTGDFILTSLPRSEAYRGREHKRNKWMDRLVGKSDAGHAGIMVKTEDGRAYELHSTDNEYKTDEHGAPKTPGIRLDSFSDVGDEFQFVGYRFNLANLATPEFKEKQEGLKLKGNDLESFLNDVVSEYSADYATVSQRRYILRNSTAVMAATEEIRKLKEAPMWDLYDAEGRKAYVRDTLKTKGISTTKEELDFAYDIFYDSNSIADYLISNIAIARIFSAIPKFLPDRIRKKMARSYYIKLNGMDSKNKEQMSDLDNQIDHAFSVFKKKELEAKRSKGKPIEERIAESRTQFDSKKSETWTPQHEMCTEFAFKESFHFISFIENKMREKYPQLKAVKGPLFLRPEVDKLDFSKLHTGELDRILGQWIQKGYVEQVRPPDGFFDYGDQASQGKESRQQENKRQAAEAVH